MTATELSIIESAKKLFIKSGYRGTSMREIATDAKVNLAMLNYYFRSKDNLFDIIFEEAFSSMANNVIEAVSGNGNILEKVERFIHAYIDGLIKNPAIPAFIFHEMLSNPQRLITKFQEKTQFQSILLKLNEQLKNDVEMGIIRPIDNSFNLFFDIVSLCVFPFIAKPIIEKITETGDEKFMKMMESRKSEVTRVMHSYLKV